MSRSIRATVVALIALAGALAAQAAPASARSSSTSDAATPFAAVRINEIESTDGDPGDWVELINTGSVPVDIGGCVLTDDDPTHRYVLPSGTVIPPGGFVVLDQASDTTAGFDFGLGSADAVRLLAPDGALVDERSWTRPSPTTLGRRPGASAGMADTLRATRGAENVFPEPLDTVPWPGSRTLTPVDTVDFVTGSLSGLDIEPSGTSAPGVLWAVENKTGTLHRLLAQPDGSRRPDPSGWSRGRTLRFADGTGTVDAEGVTVAGESSAGGVYVAAERDADRPDVSRPSILRYDVSDPADTLSAVEEWDLADDLPGLPANAGPEGVTWVPDSFLTAGGFRDERRGTGYEPEAYPGHGDGLFLVGVEGTATVYAYALMPDGAHLRVATIATPFSVVADVEFDRDIGALWVVSDDASAGRTALYALDGTGSFTRRTVQEAPAGADPAMQNEGFAIDAAATCVDGVRSTYYADDADTGGHSLRRGTYPCPGS
ncbi:lamin tail domain-containing protein [Clavibacter michiganensis]|uniref:lamin tail domain-containing protein n=1 Tax=Clavibacter michiganensis TaxID=28447 RepID=UPI000D54780A|nr:lamin tail domain-containing protein [Clavibacter michiganensis]AWG01616.1 hypothetical protein BEH62_08420 [Clavibacter michiganensis subsp. insidiosus]